MDTPITDSETLDDGALDANLQAAADLLDQYGAESGATYSISRQRGKGNEPMEFVMSCAASDYPDLDKLRTHLATTHGGGNYRLYVKINGKTVKNILIPVAEPLRVPEVKGGETAQILQFMAEQNRMMVEEIRRMSTKNGPDPIAQAIALTGAMGGMMKNLLGAAQGQGGAAFDPMEYLEKTLAFADRINGLRGDDEKDDRPWYADALESAVPIFAAALPEIAGRRAALPQPAVAPIPAAQPVAQPANQPPVMEIKNVDFKTLPAKTLIQYATPYVPKIAGFLALIQNGAILESDPGSYAVLVLDGLPSSVTDEQITGLLTRPDALDILAALYPATADYKAWYGELFKSMLADIAESGEDESGESTSGKD